MSNNNSQENKALIVYSSGAGCTEEVALKIKEKLDHSSIKTNIVKINDKDQFKSIDQQDLNQYSSILLGSSIIKGNFHKNIDKILAKLASTSGENKKLGFFVCCMKACNPEKIMEAKNQYIESNLVEYGLDFSLVDAFGGRLDFSPDSSMNFMLKKILKSIMQKDNPEMKEIEPILRFLRNFSGITYL